MRSSFFAVNADERDVAAALQAAYERGRLEAFKEIYMRDKELEEEKREHIAMTRKLLSDEYYGMKDQP